MPTLVLYQNKMSKPFDQATLNLIFPVLSSTIIRNKNREQLVVNEKQPLKTTTTTTSPVKSKAIITSNSTKEKHTRWFCGEGVKRSCTHQIENWKSWRNIRSECAVNIVRSWIGLWIEKNTYFDIGWVLRASHYGCGGCGTVSAATWRWQNKHAHHFPLPSSFFISQCINLKGNDPLSSVLTSFVLFFYRDQ